MPTQSLTVIGFSKEVTPGTFVAPTKFVPGTATPNTTKTITRPTQSRGTRSQVLDAVTSVTSGLQVSCELIPEVISQLFAGWFGTGSDSISGSSGAGYTHALTPQSAVPSFSFETDNDIYSQVLARQFVYNVIDQFTMTYQAQQLVTAQFQTVGQRETTPATPGLPSNPTPAITTLQPLDFSLLAFSVAGSPSTQLISATLTGANQSQGVPSSNGQLHVTRIAPTQRQVTFSTTLDFIDSSWYSTYWAASAGANGFVSSPGIVLSLSTANNIPGTSNPYKVQFTLPSLRPQDQFALSAASDVLQQQLTWSVTQGSAANEISAVIVNSESTALA
jgi:hypothetical protein